MSNNAPLDENRDELKDLLKQNIKLTEEVHETTQYIKKYIFWQRIIGFIKLFIILIPIIVGAIYLPPLIEKIFEQYNNFLDIGASVGGAEGVQENFWQLFK